MCDAAHHNPYGPGLKSVNEVCKRIVSILESLFVLFYQLLYYILFLMLSFWLPPYF